MTKTEHPPLTAAETAAFDAIRDSFSEVALLRAIRKSDGRPVALVVLAHVGGDGSINMTPVAEIIPHDADIHALYEDPTQ